ncbi:MAG: chloride channel protein, partial [bacterium]
MDKIKEQWRIAFRIGHLPWYLRINKFISGVIDSYHLHLSESAVTNILAITVGILTGYGAVVFRFMINFFTDFWNVTGIPYIQNLFPWCGKFAFLPVPIVGMIIVVFLVNRFAKEARGHGVPEVMEAVAIKGGRIRGRVAVIKSLASSICIGFGGSVGREGPIVQIGSALGSSISSFLRMSQERRKWLVACGAGAGIAATFNAPIAGVVFAMEVILHGSSLRSFASIVLATVSGSIIGRMYFGTMPAFEVPPYSYESNIEILFYIVLGLCAGGIGILYTKLIYYSEDMFGKMKINPLMIAAIGGLLIGVVGSFFPEVRGVGYDAITKAVNSDMFWGIMVALMFMKIIATSITLGAGGSGGIFAPAL